MAVSRVSGLEVVAMTNTSFGSLSKQLNNSLTTLLSISLEALSLLPAIASISSMTIIEGEFSDASLNNVLKFFSDSPLIPPIIAVLYLKKKGWPCFYFKSLHIAKANAVFPQPGGPVNKIPLGASILSLSKI